MINLKEVLGKKLSPRQGGEVFSFNAIGDQIVFKFMGRRTVKTKRGEDSDLVDAEVIGGEKFDAKAKQTFPVAPGNYVFFLSTTLRRDFDEEKPARGDVIHIQLVEIRPDKNNMKVYGFEFLERAATIVKAGGGDNDDIAF
jgi:hypothetical protein